MKTKIKRWIDANVWDGQDRSGAKNDSACFNPDELQELVEELYEDVMAAKVKQLEEEIKGFKGVIWQHLLNGNTIEGIIFT